MKIVNISEQFCLPSKLDLPQAMDVIVTVNYESALITISSTKFKDLDYLESMTFPAKFNFEVIEMLHNAFLGAKKGFQMLEEHYKKDGRSTEA